MSTPAKLAAFAATLAVLFGGGALAGGAIDPDRDEPRATHADAAPRTEGAHGAVEREHETVTTSHTQAKTETHTESKNTGHGGASNAAHPVRGLAVAENGLRVVVSDPDLRRGRAERLRFRIVDDAGKTVRNFDVEHERRMHLIVARRDLATFQHLHPAQQPDGSWTTDITLDEAGSYRLFADFSQGDESYTLASDLRVDGDADLRPLPAPAPTSVSDGGYDVRLDAGRARPGAEADLRFTITKDGQAVHTEPYLGAGGHLVALREGDLAFLHVHPTEHGHGEKKTAEHDDSIGFAATFPTTGRYRLFLQFKHEGRVQTVAFTQEVK
jgi:hypothetical protein